MGKLKGPLAAAWMDASEAPQRLPVYEYASRHIDLPLGYVPPGRFHVDKSRHLIAPFDALLPESRYRMVNVLKATQTGGTLLADIFVPWTIDCAPGPIMWNWHTDQLAKQHSEARAMPVLRACSRTARLLPDDRHKIRTQEIGFRNGVWLYIQGPATANLQGKSIRYLINDEVWEWKAGRIHESFARVTQFAKIGTSKILNISQGSTINDDWHRICQDAEWFEWEVPCPACGNFFVPCFERPGEGKKIYLMKWDEAGENIRLECPTCAHEMRDSDTLKAAWNATGRYRQLNPHVVSENVTYRWNSIMWLPWKSLVKRYISATRDAAKGYVGELRSFVQKVMADFWDERSLIQTERTDLASADYAPDAEWADEKFRFMTVDCQANLIDFYVVIRAWSQSGASRRLFRGRVTSFEALRALQEQFKVRSQFVAVDSGYHATKVYAQCCRHVDAAMRSWVALKGDDATHFTHTFKGGRRERRIYSEKIHANPELGMRNADVERWLASMSPQAVILYQAGKLKVPLYLWSNPSIKDILANLRDGRGAEWLRPAAQIDDPEEEHYLNQVFGEVKRRVEGPRGTELWKWHQLGPNHYFDCECMQVVCAVMGGLITPTQTTEPKADHEGT